jgi:hypothetical protein
MRRDELSERLDKMVASVQRIDTTLAKQAVTLEEHVKRTELAEHRIEHLQSQLDPIKAHVAGISAIPRFITLVSVLTGLSIALIELARLLLR